MKGKPRILHWGKTEGQKIEAKGQEWGWVWGSTVSSPVGFGAEPQPPKGFPLFSALSLS